MRIGVSGLGSGLGETGGTQVYRRELLRALASHDDRGNQYTLLLGPGDEAAGEPAGSRFEQARLSGPAAPERGLRRWARRLAGAAGAAILDPLSPQIDRLGLDVVHYPATRCDELGLHTPLLLTFFDMQEEFLPGFFHWRERWGRRLHHRAALRKAALVIAPSSFTLASLLSRYPSCAAKLRLLPVGIADRFHPGAQPGEGERLTERYGLGAEPFAFYPGNPWPHKNHARLFRALRGLALPGSEPPLVACSGRLRGESRSAGEIAAAAGYPRARVIDLGFVPEEDLPALYRAARLLVFPSLFEGYGMPVAEAFASGCPVACSNTTSLPEVAGDAAHGFDPLSEAEIREAVRDVWQDAALRERLRERGLARAARLRWDTLVPRLLALYAEAARRP